MPKPKPFSYTKKEPFRDAFFFIIVCEGQNREPEYFRFFDGISSRVKVVPVASIAGNSAPAHLINNALSVEKDLEIDADVDKLWFVIDTDRWRLQIQELRKECASHKNWQVAQSNPCFEVWLYFHAKVQLPVLTDINQCNDWKPHLPKIIKGGFNAASHPVAIETAIVNAKAGYVADGYTPEPGSTQVWQLAEELLPVVKRDLEGLRKIFTEPEIYG